MNKINLKGITSEAITGILILLVALINAVLQMFGISALPIEDGNIESIVSTIFLIGATLYNVYKNRNLSTASQTAQKITDAIKSGELLVDDVEALIDKIKNK